MKFKKLSIFLLTNIFFIVKNISFVYAEPALMLYAKDKQLLGCINCSKYDPYSIWNEYGNYGSKYNASSIWNKYGQYGSQYNSLSPFNPYSNTPPKIVDQQGNFYGYLTLNKFHSNRASNTKLVLTILSLGEKD
jgi:hypothetical protein